MARQKTALSVEIDGLMPTLKAFQGLEADLRKEANAELRGAAKTCASALAGNLTRAAVASGVPVAPRVARSIRVKSDRIPAISIGGAFKVGRNGAPAGSLVWGSEQGPKSDPNRWGVSSSSSGHWIGPTVAAFQGNEAVTVYKRAVFELQRKHGLI